MKNRTILHLFLTFFFLLTALAAQDAKDEKKERVKELQENMEMNEQDARKLEREMRRFERRFQDMNAEKMKELELRLSEMELHQLKHLAEIELPELDFEIPDIKIPEIHIPEIHVPDIHIPEMDFDFDFDFSEMEHNLGHFGPDFHFGAPHSMFRNIGEDEEIKIQAINALDSKSPITVDIVRKLLAKEASPAIRYAATRKLYSFRDDDKAVTILADVAQNDANLNVRKLAVSLLGHSENEQARTALENLAR